MKIKILTLALVLVYSTVSAGITQKLVSVVAAKNATVELDTTDILFFVSFENGTWSSPTYTHGTGDYSAGDTTGTAITTGDGERTTNAALAGSYGWRTLDSGTTNGEIEYTKSTATEDIFNNTAGAVMFNMRTSDFPADDSVMRISDSRDAGHEHLWILSQSDGSISVSWEWDNQSNWHFIDSDDSSVFLSDNTEYCIQISYNTTSDEFELYVDGTIVSDNCSSGCDNNITVGELDSIDVLLFGSNHVTADFDIDNILISTDATRNYCNEGWGDATSW